MTIVPKEKKKRNEVVVRLRIKWKFRVCKSVHHHTFK